MHQAQILANGFDCVCGHSVRLRRVDSTRENINAAIDRHLEDAERAESARPDRATIDRLVEEFKAFKEDYDGKMFAPATDSSRFVELPDIPSNFIQAFKGIVDAFPRGTFQTLERAIADPGEPMLNDVLNDLYRAKNKSR